MRKLRDIKYASGESQGVKDQLIQNLSDRRGKLLLFKSVVPIALIGGILYSIVALDGYLFENPELKEKLEAEAKAYEKNLTEMVANNPWGNSTASDSKYFFSSFFIGMKPDLKQKLMAVLDKLPDDQINFLMQIFTVIELDNAMKSQLILVFETLLKDPAKGVNKVSRLVDIIKKISEKSAEIKKAEEGIRAKTGQDESSDTQTQEELGIGATQDGIANIEFITNLLTIENPESLNYLLEEIIDLSGTTYNKLVDVLAKITDKNGETLIEVMEQLSETDTRNIVKLLSNINPKIADKLLPNVVAKLPVSKVPVIVNAALKLGVDLQEEFADTISDFSSIDHMLLLAEFVDRQTPKTVNQFVGVINGKVNIKLFESLTVTLKRLGGEVSDIVDIMAQKKFTNAIIDKGNDLLGDTLKADNAKEAVRILSKLGAPTIQKEMIEEADQLDRDNANKAIEVYKEIKIKSVEESIKVSQTINIKSKNRMASQLYRLKEYKVKTPTAVAGVRGKPKQVGRIRGVTRTQYKRIDRIEKVINKVFSLKQKDVTEAMLETSEDLEDNHLRKAGDILLDLDIETDQQRALRLMTSYRRLNRDRREDAIEVLDDMDVSHVSAAVDIAHKANSKLLNDSVDYTTNLRKRLGETEGMLATMRVVNIASRVKTNKERQLGLDQLWKEREARVRRILIQTDGHNDIFDRQVITSMSQLYKDLDEKFPKKSIQHRTPAVKLADTLSGSEGITLGTLASGGGKSRRITQEKKLERIAQYLSNDPDEQSKLDRRVEFLTKRPMSVPHESFDDEKIVENDFNVTYPDLID
jgi:hypothetical protein